MKRTLIAVVSAAATLATLATPVAAGPADPDRAAWVAEVQGAAGAPGREIARGVLADAAGGVAGNVPIEVVAWPSDTVTASMQVGDTVKLTPVARGVTGADGTFVLQVPDHVDLDAVALAEGDDVADFEIVAETVDGPAVFAFSRRIDKVGTSRVFTDPDATDQPGNRPAHVQLRPNGKARPAGSDIPVTANADDTAVVDKYCETTLMVDYGGKWDLIGQIYNTTSGVSASWTYKSGASSTLGIGVSASGSYGTFSKSGTTAKASTVTITFPSVGGNSNKYLDSQWRYGKYRIWCFDSLTGRTISTRYEARPTSFAGGSRTRTVSSAPTANYCTPYQAGSKFSKASTSNITWSNGLDISSTIGIDLSTKTGYTTAAAVNYSFSSSRKLCGTNDYPGNSPVRLVAKA